MGYRCASTTMKIRLYSRGAVEMAWLRTAGGHSQKARVDFNIGCNEDDRDG